ncbi:hypothetical protein N7522_005381 [Penicillium canescens]|nr:hypothetical protein N7522_005381 [Penicillium canescens]
MSPTFNFKKSDFIRFDGSKFLYAGVDIRNVTSILVVKQVPEYDVSNLFCWEEKTRKALDVELSVKICDAPRLDQARHHMQGNLETVVIVGSEKDWKSPDKNWVIKQSVPTDTILERRLIYMLDMKAEFAVYGCMGLRAVYLLSWRLAQDSVYIRRAESNPMVEGRRT